MIRICLVAIIGPSRPSPPRSVLSYRVDFLFCGVAVSHRMGSRNCDTIPPRGRSPGVAPALILGPRSGGIIFPSRPTEGCAREASRPCGAGCSSASFRNASGRGRARSDRPGANPGLGESREKSEVGQKCCDRGVQAKLGSAKTMSRSKKTIAPRLPPPRLPRCRITGSKQSHAMRCIPHSTGKNGDSHEFRLPAAGLGRLSHEIRDCPHFSSHNRSQTHSGSRP